MQVIQSTALIETLQRLMNAAVSLHVLGFTVEGERILDIGVEILNMVERVENPHPVLFPAERQPETLEPRRPTPIPWPSG